MRILVVEDEKRIADFLCRGLQGAGYAVDAAATGGVALEDSNLAVTWNRAWHHDRLVCFFAPRGHPRGRGDNPRDLAS